MSKKFRKVVRMENKAKYFKKLEWLCMFVAGLAIASGILTINTMEWYRSMLIILGGITVGACAEECENTALKLYDGAEKLQRKLYDDKRWRGLAKAMEEKVVTM